jgi:hypothetical protein
MPSNNQSQKRACVRPSAELAETKAPAHARVHACASAGHGMGARAIGLNYRRRRRLRWLHPGSYRPFWHE